MVGRFHVQRARRRWKVLFLSSIILTFAMFYTVAIGQVGANTSFSFGAAGDLDQTTRTETNLRAISSAGHNFFVALGDLSYKPPGTEGSWCDFVKSSVGPTFPFELISGNHEDNGPDGLIDNFARCLPDRIGSITGVYAKEYYFDYPAANPLARLIFVSPNLNFTNGGYYTYKANGEHYNWTRNAIDDARAKGIRWVIVGMHKACIATGGQTCESMAVTNLLLEKKVDLVLQSHDHNYQRSKQLSCATSGIYAESCVVNDGLSGTYDKGAGTVFVIAGTGGAGRTQVNEQDPEFNYFAQVDNTTYGYVKYSVSPSRIDAEFIGTTRYSPGQMFTDRFSVVGETPDFSMVANPDSLNIAAGSSATSTITITGTGGFSGTVALTASVSPSGLGASFSSTSVQGSGTSILTVNGSTPGTFTVTITGTSSDLTRTATIIVNVRDFRLTAGPAMVAFQAGGSGTSTITVESLNGFTGTIALTASAPSALTCSLSPTSVTLGTSATSTLSCSGSAEGTFTVTMRGTSAGLTRTTIVTFSVGPAPDFTLTSDPISVSFNAGGTGSSTVSLTSRNGFTGTVALSSSVSPSGLNCSLNPTSVALGTSGTSILSCTGSTAGTFTVTVTGTSSSLSHSATVAVTVTSESDFTLSANPTSRTISTGSSGTSTITVNSINNFNSAVALSASVSPSSGLSCSLGPTSVTPPAGGPATSTLTCTGSASGSYLVTVMGTSGSLSHSTTVTFSVTQPDFSITASPTSLRFNSGESATATITITAQSGFTDTVTLTAATSPAGLTATLNPTGVQGSGTSTLTVSGSTLGTFTVTVTGTSGSLSHSVTVSVSVVLPADFTISADPTNVGFEAGTTGRSTITLVSWNGFTGSVSLGASTSPTTGLSCSPSPSTVTLGNTASSTLFCTGSTPRTFSVTVTGTSGSLVRSVSLTVAVTDFSISSSQSSLTIRAGSSGTSTISIASLNGFSGDVSLTVSVEPTGIISVLPPTASLDPEVVHCPAGGTVSSTLTVESSLLTTPGTYRVTVTARSGSVSHSTTIDVTVTLL